MEICTRQGDVVEVTYVCPPPKTKPRSPWPEGMDDYQPPTGRTLYAKVVSPDGVFRVDGIPPRRGESAKQAITRVINNINFRLILAMETEGISPVNSGVSKLAIDMFTGRDRDFF